jgi:arginyl-tRNA synthetase
MREDIKKLLNEAILQAKKAQGWSDFDVLEISVDYAKNEQFGDYTSNMAMVLAGKLEKSRWRLLNKLLNC